MAGTYEDVNVRICKESFTDMDLRLGLVPVHIGAQDETKFEIPSGPYYLFPVRDRQGNLDPKASQIYVCTGDYEEYERRWFQRVSKTEKRLMALVCHEFEVSRTQKNLGLMWREADRAIMLYPEEQQELIELLAG